MRAACDTGPPWPLYKVALPKDCNVGSSEPGARLIMPANKVARMCILKCCYAGYARLHACMHIKQILRRGHQRVGWLSGCAYRNAFGGVRVTQRCASSVAGCECMPARQSPDTPACKVLPRSCELYLACRDRNRNAQCVTNGPDASKVMIVAL